MGCLDYRNASTTGAGTLMELVSEFAVDAPQLWNELHSYQAFASTLEPLKLQHVVQEIWGPSN